MKVGLIDVDGHNFPNLALMKIKGYYGDSAEWYSPFEHYDVVYMSKVFTFTPDYQYYINADEVRKGGTGYNMKMDLFCDNARPDYTLYKDYKFYDSQLAYGFTTRGCPNKCSWCVVPKKEGLVKPYDDVENIAQGRKKLILMDNNILASDYGLGQLEKCIKLDYRIDLNQAMDARLITDDVAKLLAKIKWLRYIRFGCDTHRQIEDCRRAIELIRKYNDKQTPFFLYTILRGDIEECYERTTAFRNDSRVTIFAQPYRNFIDPKQAIPQWQKDMARWANRTEIWRTTDFKDYNPRQGIICKQYF